MRRQRKREQATIFTITPQAPALAKRSREKYLLLPISSTIAGEMTTMSNPHVQPHSPILNLPPELRLRILDFIYPIQTFTTPHHDHLIQPSQNQRKSLAQRPGYLLYGN